MATLTFFLAIKIQMWFARRSTAGIALIMLGNSHVRVFVRKEETEEVSTDEVE